MGTWQTKREKIKPFVKSILVNIMGEKYFDYIKNTIKKW